MHSPHCTSLLPATTFNYSGVKVFSREREASKVGLVNGQNEAVVSGCDSGGLEGEVIVKVTGI